MRQVEGSRKGQVVLKWAEPMFTFHLYREKCVLLSVTPSSVLSDPNYVVAILQL